MYPFKIEPTNAFRQVLEDTLAEWLRRGPAKPMGSPRVGSNPTGVEFADLRCGAITATPRGFEPLRAEPNRFRVHVLTRSDTMS